MEIKTLAELANMGTNDEGVFMIDDAKITVTRGEYVTAFEVETRSNFYARCVNVPNTLIDMINYSATCKSNSTNTILYYMAGYDPCMTLKQLTTVEIIIGGLIHD